MNKQEIIDLLTEKYHSFIHYIHGLTAEELLFSNQQKWTAGQQLEHIVLCVKPIVQVFSLDPATIQQNFGATSRPGRSYGDVRNDYNQKLKEGGKAPENYVPAAVPANQIPVLSEKLEKMIASLCTKITAFTDENLDTLCIPHPLLGSLTLREMLYNVIDHVEHHHALTIQNLNYK